MIKPTFKELFALRNVAGAAAEVSKVYAASTRQSFDHENGVPVIVSAYQDQDVPFLIAALSRSTIQLAPRIVNNAPGNDDTTNLAESMGARVTEEYEIGQMSALRTGIQKTVACRPDVPILVTDADCMPQRKWAETMLKKANLSREVGGIAFGSVIIEHGPSVTTDVLRTVYALGGDVLRWTCQSTPRAHGPSCLLQLDSDRRVADALDNQPNNVFPCDVALRTCVITAGGETTSILDPRAAVFTRGDRFANITALARDFFQGGFRENSPGRAKLYRQE